MIIEVTPYATPETDLQRLEEGHAVAVYVNAKAIGFIQLDEFFPEASGPALVLWELPRKIGHIHDDDLVHGNGRFDTSGGQWKTIAYAALEPDVNPLSLLVPMVDKYRKRQPKPS